VYPKVCQNFWGSLFLRKIIWAHFDFGDWRLITNQESMKTTPIALTNFMITGPIDLFDSGIGFRIKNFNKWELKSIFDYIKFFIMHKPTKIICSINQI
jgi:hypothetical protein